MQMTIYDAVKVGSRSNCVYPNPVTVTDADTMRQHAYPETLAVMEGYLGRIFSTPSVQYVTDT